MTQKICQPRIDIYWSRLVNMQRSDIGHIVAI